MDHEEGIRRPFEPTAPAAPLPPADRPDHARAWPAPELARPGTADVGLRSAPVDERERGSDQAVGVVRDRADRIEDCPPTPGDAVEMLRPEHAASGVSSQSEPIAARPAPDLDALTAALASLEKQISRAGREQFKASTLAEAQRDQLHVVLEALRAAETARNDEVDALRGERTIIASQGRREVARAILPAADGLEGALRSGKHLLTASPPPPRRSWWRRSAPSPAAEDGLRGDLRAWLIGLEFVQERLLSVLAAEDIIPIAALGLPFDPRIHLAVEVCLPGPNTPSGTVTAVIRQGYLIGGRVLRPAEVAVARAD